MATLELFEVLKLPAEVNAAPSSQAAANNKSDYDHHTDPRVVSQDDPLKQAFVPRHVEAKSSQAGQ